MQIIIHISIFLIQIIQQKSEFNYAYTPLPAGDTLNNFTLSCGLIVSDIFDAETSAYNDIIVRRNNDSLTPNITLLFDYIVIVFFQM